MREVIVLLGAEIEFQETYARLYGTGREHVLETAFAEALMNLGQYPHMGSAFRAQYRRLLLEDFPQALYYTVETGRIFIHAFVDIRRDPEAILRRLGLHT